MGAISVAMCTVNQVQDNPKDEKGNSMERNGKERRYRRVPHSGKTLKVSEGLGFIHVVAWLLGCLVACSYSPSVGPGVYIDSPSFIVQLLGSSSVERPMERLAEHPVAPPIHVCLSEY